MSIKKFAFTLITATTLTFSSGCATTSLPTSAVVTSQRRVNIQKSTPVKPPKVRLRIKKAEIEVSAKELNKQFKAILELSGEKRLINTNLVPDPIGNGLTLTGKVKVPVFPGVPFSVHGSITAKPGNIIHFEAEKVKVVGIPVKGLMDVIGLELSNIAKFDEPFGRVVQKGNGFDLIVHKFTDDAIIEGEMKRIASSPSGITVFF